ncbi:MAG: hypothetical protein ACYCW6_23485 [Candidatus Xenobia bacterium]
MSLHKELSRLARMPGNPELRRKLAELKPKELLELAERMGTALLECALPTEHQGDEDNAVCFFCGGHVVVDGHWTSNHRRGCEVQNLDRFSVTLGAWLDS